MKILQRRKKWTREMVLPALLVFFAALMCNRVAHSDEWSFDAAKGFPIRLGDTIVVESAAASWPQRGDEKIVSAPHALTLVGAHSRREFARLDDGKLEATFQFNLPASADTMNYCLLIPLPTGTTARVSHGDYSRPVETVVPKIGAMYQTIRFLSIETPRGGFAIDTDPLGAFQDLSDFDKAIRQTNVKVTPEGLQLCFARRFNDWGHGRIRSKLVFYNTPRTFESTHPFATTRYNRPLESLYALSFTGRKSVKVPFSVGTEVFDSQRGYGWLNPPTDLKIADRMPKALYHSSLASASQPATFQMLAPPGDYFLTVIVGDLENAVGPMQVTLDDKLWLTDLRVEKAEFVSKNTIVSPSDGVIQLKLSGQPWTINGLILQPLILENEDYLRRRIWWNHAVTWPNENSFPQSSEPGA